MTRKVHEAPAPGADQVDQDLRRQLQEIEKEETPARLLELARELQRLLRKDGD